MVHFIIKPSYTLHLLHLSNNTVQDFLKYGPKIEFINNVFMQNILNVTLNNNLKNLALLSLFPSLPKPTNTGLSSMIPMIINSKGQGNILCLRVVTESDLPERKNLCSRLSTRRNTKTTYTYVKSRTFLYTSNNHKANTIKTFTKATTTISDFIEDSFTGF